jgi:hypothetical protein
MDLFEVVKCSTPVYTDLYIYNVKGIKFKCESSDSPVELFFCQHLFNRITGINIRVNQQISKPSICPPNYSFLDRIPLSSEKRPNVTVVAYPPIIDAKTTDMSTVLRAMQTCLNMSMNASPPSALMRK